MKSTIYSAQKTSLSNPKIDYQKISHAIDFYASQNFQYTEAPWIVSKYTDKITAPKNVRFFQHFMGCNVASGEQSFLELIINKELEAGKYACCTPCFRDEPELDELHHNWFMKVELIDFLGHTKINSKEQNKRFDYILNTSKKFFDSYLKTEIIDTKSGQDIISKKEKIELGSYGIRSHKDFSWIYGTGIAEPRLSQVLEKRKKGYHLEDIPKGEKGKPSQIYEEIQEFKDALKQNNPLMALQELSDTIGAIELYLEKNFQSQITLEDLIKMKNTTKRVFENGKR